LYQEAHHQEIDESVQQANQASLRIARASLQPHLRMIDTCKLQELLAVVAK
jgi:hypothetical protein